MKSAGMRLGSVAELETYIRRPRNIGSASSIPVRLCVHPVQALLEWCCLRLYIG